MPKVKLRVPLLEEQPYWPCNTKTGANLHQDENQVIGERRDGYDHEWNGFNQVSAEL